MPHICYKQQQGINWNVVKLWLNVTMEDYSFSTGVMFNTFHISRREQANKIGAPYGLAWRGGGFQFLKACFSSMGLGAIKRIRLLRCHTVLWTHQKVNEHFLLQSDLWPEKNVSTWVKEWRREGLFKQISLVSLTLIIQSCLIVFALVCGLGERETISPPFIFFARPNCLFFFGKQRELQRYKMSFWRASENHNV